MKSKDHHVGKHSGVSDIVPLDVNYVPVQAAINWDEYFMLQAILASFRSKDPNTKVGCVVVDENNRQISMGYNGTIAGIDESQIPWGNDRRVPLEYQKYGYVMHSEANALSHASKSLRGARLYVTLFPCHECAKLIASQKIGEVVYLSDKYSGTSENIVAKRIFDLTHIPYRQLKIKPQTVKKVMEYFEKSVFPDEDVNL